MDAHRRATEYTEEGAEGVFNTQCCVPIKNIEGMKNINALINIVLYLVRIVV